MFKLKLGIKEIQSEISPRAQFDLHIEWVVSNICHIELAWQQGLLGKSRLSVPWTYMSWLNNWLAKGEAVSLGADQQIFGCRKRGQPYRATDLRVGS
jgi:hypothetical protein